MVRVAAERLGDDPLEPGLDLVDGLARREAGTVANAEDVRVDREGFLAERGIEDDVGGLAADAGQRLQFLARSRDLATVPVDQRLAEPDEVLRLGIEQTDGLDRLAQAFLTEINHLAR